MSGQRARRGTFQGHGRGRHEINLRLGQHRPCPGRRDRMLPPAPVEVWCLGRKFIAAGWHSDSLNVRQSMVTSVLQKKEVEKERSE